MRKRRLSDAAVVDTPCERSVAADSTCTRLSGTLVVRELERACNLATTTTPGTWQDDELFDVCEQRIDVDLVATAPGVALDLTAASNPRFFQNVCGDG